jgi:uncharacterized membrane protein
VKFKDYLKSRTVWGSLLISFSLTPLCPVAWIAAAQAAGAALAGVGIKGAIENRKNEDAK